MATRPPAKPGDDGPSSKRRAKGKGETPASTPAPVAEPVAEVRKPRPYRAGRLADKAKNIKEPRVRKIVERMVFLDMTQTRFCALTGIDTSRFSRWLDSPSIRLDASAASRIAEALQVTVESVLDATPSRPLVPVEKRPLTLAIHEKVDAMIRKHGELKTLVLLDQADPKES